MRRLVQRIITTHPKRASITSKQCHHRWNAAQPLFTPIITRQFHSSSLRQQSTTIDLPNNELENENADHEHEQYAVKLLESVSDLSEFQTAVEQEFREYNYTRALAMLRVFAGYLQQYKQPDVPLSHEETANVYLWEAYISRSCSQGYYSIGKFDESLAWCDHMISLEKEFKKLGILDQVFTEYNYTVCVKAILLSEVGDSEGAIKYFNFIIDSRIRKRMRKVVDPVITAELRNSLKVLLTERGKAYYRASQIQKAFEDASESLEIDDSRDIESFLLRARCQFAMDNFEEGRIDVEKAMQNANGNVVAIRIAKLALVDMELHLGELDKALELVNEAIAISPAALDGRATRLNLNINLGNYEDALADCRFILSSYPSRTLEVYESYNKLLLATNRYDELLEFSDTFCTMEQLGHISEERKEFYRYIAYFSVHLLKGEYAQALQLTQDTISSNQFHSSYAQLIQMDAIYVHILQGTLEKAYELAKKITKVEIESASDIFELLKWVAHSGYCRMRGLAPMVPSTIRNEKELAEYILNLPPEHRELAPRLMEMYGMAYYFSGQYYEAMRYFERAVMFGKQFVRVDSLQISYMFWAFAAAEVNDLELAKTKVEEAMKIAKQNVLLPKILERFQARLNLSK